MKISLDSPDESVARLAARVVQEGGVVLHPTDTIYGLGCDPWREESVETILQLKGRLWEKGFLVLVRYPDWVRRVAEEVPPLLEEMAAEFWPGPVTLLLSARPGLPSSLRGEQGKIGVRVPASPFLQRWLEVLQKPLLSTSANRSGEPPPTTLQALKSCFGGRVDLFLEAGEPQPRSPSTVVDLTTSPPRIVREGEEAQRVRAYLSARFPA